MHSMSNCLRACRWIVARYDVDEFDHQKNQSVKIDSTPLNEAVDILEFDYSGKEVEVC